MSGKCCQLRFMKKGMMSPGDIIYLVVSHLKRKQLQDLVSFKPKTYSLLRWLNLETCLKMSLGNHIDFSTWGLFLKCINKRLFILMEFPS